MTQNPNVYARELCFKFLPLSLSLSLSRDCISLCSSIEIADGTGSEKIVVGNNFFFFKSMAS